MNTAVLRFEQDLTDESGIAAIAYGRRSRLSEQQ
jgi:hypothetical protein